MHFNWTSFENSHANGVFIPRFFKSVDNQVVHDLLFCNGKPYKTNKYDPVNFDRIMATEHDIGNLFSVFFFSSFFSFHYYYCFFVFNNNESFLRQWERTHHLCRIKQIMKQSTMLTMADDRTVTNDHQFDDAVNLNLMRQLVYLIGWWLFKFMTSNLKGHPFKNYW